jgi:GNAT superfamily N-acetyltransferase
MGLFSRNRAAAPDAAVTIRRAGPGDAEVVAELARALSLADGGRPSRFSAQAYLRDGFGDAPAFTVLLAECDGQVAGYALYYPGYDTDRATRGVYLADLFVREGFRRKGAATALMRAAAQAARDAGGSWMFWSVMRRNKGARRFYRTIATELSDVLICAAFGRGFDRLSDPDNRP